MIKSDFTLENKLLSESYDFIIGIDEAGRGPLAGPVVACADSFKFFKTSPAFGHSSLIKEGMREVLLKQFDLIRDSKTLSCKQREKLFDFIHEHFYVGVGVIDHKAIDRVNILEATFLAMKAAISALTHNVEYGTQNDKLYAIRYARKIILIDGNKKIPNFSHEQKTVVNGDKIVKSISAASIIAKVTRDRIMHKMHKAYPEYQFDRHKGYGTKLHMEALRKYGPSEIHRKSFKPVKSLLRKR